MPQSKPKKSTATIKHASFRSKFLNISRSFQAFTVLAVIVGVGISSYALGFSSAASTRQNYTINYCYRLGVTLSTVHKTPKSCVKSVQVMVNDYGCGNSGTRSLDGDYGSGTKSAVSCWQSKYNKNWNPSPKLVVDGIAGPNTLKQMNHYCANKTDIRKYCYAN